MTNERRGRLEDVLRELRQVRDGERAAVTAKPETLRTNRELDDLDKLTQAVTRCLEVDAMKAHADETRHDKVNGWKR